MDWAKVIVNLPGQTIVEHWHPRWKDDPGKEELLRCLWGTGRLYIPGEDNYQCRHEIILKPMEQFTLPPGMPHWFQHGDVGFVICSFSTQVTDQEDCFRNPKINRVTVSPDLDKDPDDLTT